MTGGYGNSYAAAAGNQAYQAYLSQLNDVVPELYAMALDQYNQEGDELYREYGMFADAESEDYGRWVDEYNRWASEREDLQGVLRDSVLDDQWAADHELRENADAREEEAFEIDKQDHEDSSKSYSGTTADGKSYNNGSLTNAQIKELQAALGIDADGYYGSESKDAADGLSAEEAYAKYVSDYATSETSKNESNITSSIEEKAASFESNDALADWAYSLADAGTITEDEAYSLISTYMDQNEKYVDEEDGTKSISYSDMVKSTNGWSVVDNGGVNWMWGVDKNAIIKAPNGEQIRLDNLVDYLVNEGMSKSDAKSYVKTLQKNLGI